MTTFPHVVEPMARIAGRARWRERAWWCDAALLVASGLFWVSAAGTVWLCFLLDHGDFVDQGPTVLVGGALGPLAGAVAYGISGGLVRAPAENRRPVVGWLVGVLGAVGGLPPALYFLRITREVAAESARGSDRLDVTSSTLELTVFTVAVCLVTLLTAALTTAWMVNLARAWAWMRDRWSFARSTFALATAVGAAIGWLYFDPFDVW